MTVPRNNNNQENTNNPFQAAGSLFGGALEEILANTDVRIGPDGIKVEVNQDSACPPLLGERAPPGCDKTFADDGNIPCWDDTDCPSPGTCENNFCNFYVPSDNTDCPQPPAPPGCIPFGAFLQESDGGLPPYCPPPVSCFSVTEVISFTRSD